MSSFVPACWQTGACNCRNLKAPVKQLPRPKGTPKASPKKAKPAGSKGPKTKSKAKATKKREPDD